MEDIARIKGVRQGATLARDGAVLVSGVAFWTGRIISSQVDDLTELTRRPEASHSALWLLDSHDGRTARMIATDDPAEILPIRDGDPGSWSRIYCITHIDDMLSRGRCIRLAAIMSDRLQAGGIGCLPPAAVAEMTIDERDDSDMRIFAAHAMIALEVSGLKTGRSGE
jgi:hypothetical protein